MKLHKKIIKLHMNFEKERKNNVYNLCNSNMNI